MFRVEQKKAQLYLEWVKQQEKSLANKGEDDKMPKLHKIRRAIERKRHDDRANFHQQKEANRQAEKEQELLLRREKALKKSRKENAILEKKVARAASLGSLGFDLVLSADTMHDGDDEGDISSLVDDSRTVSKTTSKRLDLLQPAAL